MTAQSEDEGTSTVCLESFPGESFFCLKRTWKHVGNLWNCIWINHNTSGKMSYGQSSFLALIPVFGENQAATGPGHPAVIQLIISSLYQNVLARISVWQLKHGQNGKIASCKRGIKCIPEWLKYNIIKILKGFNLQRIIQKPNPEQNLNELNWIHDSKRVIESFM